MPLGKTYIKNGWGGNNPRATKKKKLFLYDFKKKCSEPHETQETNFKNGQNRTTEKFYEKNFTRYLKILILKFSIRFRTFQSDTKNWTTKLY